MKEALKGLGGTCGDLNCKPAREYPDTAFSGMGIAKGISTPPPQPNLGKLREGLKDAPMGTCGDLRCTLEAYKNGYGPKPNWLNDFPL